MRFICSLKICLEFTPKLIFIDFFFFFWMCIIILFKNKCHSITKKKMFRIMNFCIWISLFRTYVLSLSGTNKIIPYFAHLKLLLKKRVSIEIKKQSYEFFASQKFLYPIIWSSWNVFIMAYRALLFPVLKNMEACFAAQFIEKSKIYDAYLR